MLNGKRILAIAKKEYRHIGRDSGALYFALGMPLLLLVLFGYAVSFDLERIKTLVVDQDRSVQSRRLVNHFFAGETFDLVASRDRVEDVERAMQQGEATLGLVVPNGFGRDLFRSDDVPLQVLIDGADNVTAATILAYVGRFVGARRWAEEQSPTLSPEQAVESRTRALYNPRLRSVVFLVPGLIALIQSLMAVMLTAVTIAREWESGSMEQLLATPLTRGELIVGKFIPYFTLAMLQLALILIAAVTVFDVPVRGSVALLCGISAMFIFAMLGQGLVLSIVTKNQMVATQLAVISTLLPVIVLSGFIMPIDNMPHALQLVTEGLPARFFIDALRGVMLRGVGFESVMKDAAVMLGFGLAMIALAAFRFKRRVA